MAKRGVVIYVKYFVVCSILSVTSSLTLSNTQTSKPRQTKHSSSTSAPSPGSGSLVSPAPAVSLPVTEKSGIALYRVTNDEGKTCILLKTDALIEINFRLHNDDERGDTYVPEKPIIEGNCRNQDDASMKISWKGYSLLFNFDKTPGGERWYISKLELTVSTDLPMYHNIRVHGDSFRLSQRKTLIPTPVGKSYSCEETVVPLTPDRRDGLPFGLNGTIFFRAFQLQPFMYKDDNFGQPFECNAVKDFRDETAPIAVGSTLAIAVLMTITGYGIYRYMKVKKVQYNTME